MQNKRLPGQSGASAKQRSISVALLAAGILYFILFIFPNATGARTVAMLQVFQVDEYAQFPNVIHMLTPGGSLIESLRNFIIYLHYFYGYIFYFVSALVLLPLRFGMGSRWADNVTLLVTCLRQGVSVLPALASIYVLTYLQTGFRSWLRSSAIFLLLLSVPALVNNNLWWHPDSLGLLLVVLIFFFLDRDQLRFKRHFFIAAALCGAAVGTKYLGVFFVFAVPLYLLLGIFQKKMGWRRACLLALAFVLVMAACVVVTNPLLLMPQERAALIQYQMLQYQQTMGGIIVRNTQPFFENGQYPPGMVTGYGFGLFALLAIFGLAAGLLRPATRTRALLMLVFMLPLSYTIINAATRRDHYWLPVFIPLISCLVFLFPESAQEPPGWTKNARSPSWLQPLRRGLPWLVLAFILVQFLFFIRTDLGFYFDTLNRENTSPSLAFNQKLNTLLANLPRQDKKYVAYRDWHIYFPDSPSWQAEMTWDITTEHFIRELNPVMILFEQDNLTLYNDPQAQQNAVNPEDMKLARELYQAAANNRLEGYQLFYSDHFALALIRKELAQYTR